MGSKTLLILAAFLASISLGTAIKCYVCAGSETSDCAKGKQSAMSVVNCKPPGSDFKHRTYTYYNVAGTDEPELDDAPELKAVCLKLFETDYQPKLFARGCGMFPTSLDPCDFLEQHSHITGCKSCKTDLCNQRSELQEDFSLYNVID